MKKLLHFVSTYYETISGCGFMLLFLITIMAMSHKVNKLRSEVVVLETKLIEYEQMVVDRNIIIKYFLDTITTNLAK